MNWRFTDCNTLVEITSGYTIRLMSGTWFHPGQLKPESPRHIDFSQQMKLLRSGLKHIQSIGRERQVG